MDDQIAYSYSDADCSIKKVGLLRLYKAQISSLKFDLYKRKCNINELNCLLKKKDQEIFELRKQLQKLLDTFDNKTSIPNQDNNALNNV